MDRRSEKQQYKVNCLTTGANDQRRIDTKTDKTTLTVLKCVNDQGRIDKYTLSRNTLKNKPKDRLTDRQDGINMCKRPRTADLTDTQIV